MPALHQDLRAPMSGTEHQRGIDGDGHQERKPHRADRNALPDAIYRALPDLHPAAAGDIALVSCPRFLA
jgi:hypothetical protein